jgi:plasmid maintenance system antidote protein VapI
MTETITRVERLCAERGLDSRELAERTGVDERRVEAIVQERWTPSPQDRDRIAAAFGLSRERVVWGHRNFVEHLYGWGET